jgi:hypothetical protein
VPIFSVVASPAASIVATAGSTVSHATTAVRSAVDESSYVPVARYWRVPSTGIAGVVGDTLIETSVGPESPPPPPPHAARIERAIETRARVVEFDRE